MQNRSSTPQIGTAGRMLSVSDTGSRSWLALLEPAITIIARRASMMRLLGTPLALPAQTMGRR